MKIFNDLSTQVVKSTVDLTISSAKSKLELADTMSKQNYEDLTKQINDPNLPVDLRMKAMDQRTYGVHDQNVSARWAVGGLCAVAATTVIASAICYCLSNKDKDSKS